MSGLSLRSVAFLANATTIFDSDYELISTTILSSNQSSVDFTSLETYASEYKHLQFRISSRSTNAATTTRLLMRINSGTDGYFSHGLFTRGTTGASYFLDKANHIRISQDMLAAGSTANTYTAVIVDMLDVYNSNKRKVFRSLAGHTSGSDQLISIHSAMYDSASNVSSVSFSSGNNGWQDANNIASGSRFSLYGIKG